MTTRDVRRRCRKLEEEVIELRRRLATLEEEKAQREKAETLYKLFLVLRLIARIRTTRKPSPPPVQYGRETAQEILERSREIESCFGAEQEGWRRNYYIVGIRDEIGELRADLLEMTAEILARLDKRRLR